MGRRVDMCIDCGRVRAIAARGLCGTCYQRARHAGDLPPRIIKTLDELLAMSRGSDPVLCWTWRGAVNSEGIPIYGYGRNHKYVCRHVWLTHHRRRNVPAGKSVSHTCGIKACINPDHLELVPIGDNLRDIHAARRMAALR